MKKVTLLFLLIFILSLQVVADSGISNLYYGITEGSKDLILTLKKPLQLNYLQTTLAFTSTAFLTIFDAPISNYFYEMDSLKTAALIFSESTEPVSLGIIYSLFGWKDKELARKIVGSSLYTQLNTNGLKYLIGKSRPQLAVDDGPIYIGPNLKKGYNSFPSGHTAQSFSLATVLSEEFPKYRFLFYTWSSGVGISRLILGRHYPSDVFSGAVLGTFSAKHYLNTLQTEN